MEEGWEKWRVASGRGRGVVCGIGVFGGEGRCRRERWEGVGHRIELKKI